MGHTLEMFDGHREHCCGVEDIGGGHKTRVSGQSIQLAYINISSAILGLFLLLRCSMSSTTTVESCTLLQAKSETSPRLFVTTYASSVYFRNGHNGHEDGVSVVCRYLSLACFARITLAVTHFGASIKCHSVCRFHT